jgi:sodium-dependent dicarboxylate transporter 2/3/5
MTDAPERGAARPTESPPLAARIGLWAGPIAALTVFFLLPSGDGGLAHAARACGGVATLMAVWWMTEALPLEATALLPLVLLPLVGVYTTRLERGDLVRLKGSGHPGIVESQDDTSVTVLTLMPDDLEGLVRVRRGEVARDSPFKRAAAPFADPAIFLFLGGFLIALAIEKWGLHRRIALLTVLAVGTQPSRLIGGFMLATGLVSMWISNTATTVMMLPIGLAVVGLLQAKLARGGQMSGVRKHPDDDVTSENLEIHREADVSRSPVGSSRSSDATNFAICLLLGIAYAASLGGFATLVGTPPNVYFKAFMTDRDLPIDFGRWMLFATPLSAVYLLLAWLLMTKVLFPVKLAEIPGGRELIRDEYRKLGPVSRGEWIVLTVFLCTATLWIFGEPLKQWSALTRLLPVVKALDDYLVAMAGAIALFLIPVNPSRHEFALDWKTALRLPWGVLLLFGGGLSLAAAITDSGLAEWIGRQVTVLRSLPTLWQIVFIVALIVFSGELTNNLAAVVAMLPILFEVAAGMEVDPLLLTVPAVVAASCGFMLPVATPPNAIAFASGHIPLRQMVRAGFLLDLLAIVLIPAAIYAWGAWVLGIRL